MHADNQHPSEANGTVSQPSSPSDAASPETAASQAQSSGQPQSGVIVTGAAGLIGQPVCRALALAGHRVFGLDRVALPDSLAELPNVQHIHCDVTEKASVSEAVQQVRHATGGRLASVVHLAAFYDFSGEESELYRKVTIEGTDRLLRALGDFQLEQFLFSSTMLVHAPCEIGELIGESDPLDAKWPYPESKIQTEHLIRDGYPQVRSVFLRLAGIYTDQGQQPTLVQQIKRVYESSLKSHFFPGNVHAGQSMVHLDDAVEAVVLAVQQRKKIPPQSAILIGEPDPMPYQELQEEIGRALHGREWSTAAVPKSVAKAGAAVTDTLSGGNAFIKPFMIEMADDHYALDISRAKGWLNWQPRHHLRRTLPKILESLKSDPEGFYKANKLD